MGITIYKSAHISDCEKYRYALWRTWDKNLEYCTWVMLNPSTADADNDDPTIIRCMNYAKAWGYGGILVVNLFSFRATSPKDMKKATNPVCPDYSDDIEDALEWENFPVICAWGNHGSHRGRDKEVLEIIRQHTQPLCLKVTKAGQPVHPLYQPKDLKPIPLPTPPEGDK